MLRRSVIALVVLAGFAPVAKSQSETWVEVGTPHFLVVSNSVENDARRVGRQFELMRSAFQQIFPDAKLDTATPIVVLAVQDKTNLQALVPPAYLGKGKLTVAGLFVQAPEKNYILVWLNSPGVHPFAPIYHEYTHFVMSRTGEWMPLWLSEGLAEFYQNTEIYSDEVRVGKVDTYLLDFLHQHPPMPLATLFAVDVHSPNYHQEDEGSVFYTESWALTHFLKTKDDREGTHRLDDYLALVRGGMDNMAAATQAFGPLDMLQADLQKYLVNEDFGYIRMPGLLPVDESSFSMRTVSKLEADAVRAEFLSRVGRDGDARTLLESVLHDDPANVSAYDSMGYMAYRSQNFDEARKWCEKAMALDPRDFLAQYCFGASLLKKGPTDNPTLGSIESSLRNVTRLNPAFAPAFDGLGTVLAIRGKYAESQQLMQKSVQLDPGNVELRLDQANVFMRMSKTQEAIHTLELALKIAHTPEQVAAVESVLQYSKRYETERGQL
jgi:tetratricopeptide (TPR) repeat protein